MSVKLLVRRVGQSADDLGPTHSRVSTKVFKPLRTVVGKQEEIRWES